MRTEIKVDDIAVMRKPHPCGIFEWKVGCVGADVGLECLKCRRKVVLDRNTFECRLKETKPQ